MPMLRRQKLLAALPAIERYALSVLAVVCILAIRLVLDPVLANRAPYLFFLLAVALVRHLWGRGPGLLATVMGGVSAWYFIIEPRFSFAIANRVDTLNLAAYFAVGAGISFLGESASRLPASGAAGGRSIKLRVVRQTAVLAGAAVVLVGMVLLLQRDFRRTQEAEGWVVHTYQVMNSAESLLSTLKDAERGERGYLLTGDEAYLAPYNSAIAALPRGLNELKHLTSDNLRQQARWIAINRLTGERLAVLKRAVELRKASEVEAALTLVRSGEGELDMEELRSTLDEVIGEEHRLLAERTAEAKLQATRGRWILGLGSGALVLLLVFASAIIERETVRREEITQALRRHADLLEQAHDSLLTYRRGGPIDFWSRGAEILYGYTRPEAVGRSSHELLQSYHPLGMAPIDAMLERDGEWKGELTQTTKDGRKIIVEARWKVAVDAAGNKTVLEANHDITERKRAEEELRRVNRAMQTISECDQVLVRATEESHLLDDICGTMVQVGGYRMAWVGYVEHDEGKSVSPVAHAGFEEGYLQAANITWGDTERGQGPTGTAMRTRRPVVTRNIQTGPGFSPWREDALKRGYLSNVALPIILDDQVLGALTVYADEADAFDSAEVQLLTQLSDDLAYGIQALRTRAERKRAEEALRQSETQLREALLAAQMGVWEWTVETDTVTWDENLYRIAGRDPKLPAPSFQDQPQLYSRESWERLKSAVENALATGTLYDLDLEMVRPDGSKRWLIARGEPLRNANGHITHLRGTVQDITERKQAEAQNLLLATAIEQAAETVVITDRDATIQYVNPAFTRTTGYTRGEALGRNPRVLKSGRHDTKFYQDLWANLTAGKIWRGEFTNRRKDGTLYMEEATIAPVRDAHGEITNYIAIKSDITKRKRAEEALRESDQRYKDFISHTNEGVWRVELERPVPIDLPEEEIWERFAQNAYMAECNLAHARNLGFSTLEEVVGVPLRDLISPSDQERLESYRSATRGGLRNRTVEFRSRDKTGNFRHFLRAEIPIIQDGMLVRIWGINRDVTELRQAEEALKQSEYLLRESQRIGKIGSYELDLASGDVSCSVVMDDIFGIGRDYRKDAAGWLAFVHPDQREEIGAYLRQVIAEKKRFERDYRIVRPIDGAERWVSGNGELVLDSQSRPVKMIGTIRDITEAKRAEEALKRSEFLLRESQRVGRIGSYEFDIASGRFSTSATTDEIFGVGAEYPKDINGWLALVHPDERERMGALLQHAIAEKQRSESIFCIVRRCDGAERWVSANGDVVLDSQSRPVKVIGTIQDITEAKRAEEALKESELRFRQLFERSESALALFETVFYAQGNSSGYRCLDINPACERIMGVSRSQVLGRCAHEMYPALGKYCSQLFDRVAATDEPVAFEDYSPTLGRYFAGSAYSPRPNQFAVSFMDVNERKLAEESIRRLNLELEERVRSRTAELEAANQELEAFTHSVSHDLRAPLRGIDGWSLALLEDYGQRLDAQGNKYLLRVRSEAQRMGRLIDDLLHLSRVSRAELVHGTVDLTSLAEAIAARLKEANPGRPIEFVVAPNLKCRGDAPLLEVALTNLLDNAVKFTGPRTPARVEFGQTECDGNTAFFVRDNGVGFDMEYAGMLFAPFQRLHKTSEFPGMGIGLATVQRVIHRHGGRIWAEAQVGAGATLYFTLGENKS